MNLASTHGAMDHRVGIWEDVWCQHVRLQTHWCQHVQLPRTKSRQVFIYRSAFTEFTTDDKDGRGDGVGKLPDYINALGLSQGSKITRKPTRGEGSEEPVSRSKM